MTSLRWEGLSERLSIFAIHRALYRTLGGRLVGRNVLILTTTGRSSGWLRQAIGPESTARPGAGRPMESYSIVHWFTGTCPGPLRRCE